MFRAYEVTHLTQGQNTHIFRERKAKKTLSGPVRKQEPELQEEPKKSQLSSRDCLLLLLLLV